MARKKAGRRRVSKTPANRGGASPPGTKSRGGSKGAATRGGSDRSGDGKSAATGPLSRTGGTVPGHETRTRILQTAFQLFHEQGFHATGIATILRQANVNAGSLYHFFPSKDELLIGVLEYALDMLRPMVMGPAEQRTDDPLERVFELLAQYREGMQLWGCRMGCPIGNLALEVADDSSAARALIHQNFQNWINAVQMWLDEAGPRLPEDIDRAQLARFVLTVMEGGIMQARAAGELTPFDDSVAQLRSYFSTLERVAARATSGGRSGRRTKRN